MLTLDSVILLDLLNNSEINLLVFLDIYVYNHIICDTAVFFFFLPHNTKFNLL